MSAESLKSRKFNTEHKILKALIIKPGHIFFRILFMAVAFLFVVVVLVVFLFLSIYTVWFVMFLIATFFRLSHGCKVLSF